MEGLEKIFTIAIAVGLSLLFMTANEFEPKIRNIKSISELNKNQKQIFSEIESIKTLITQLKTDLNEAKKAQSIVNALAFNSLKVEQEAHNDRIKELEDIFTRNPEKARELFDINQAYSSLEKSVSKHEEKLADLQSQIVSGVFSNSSFYYGLALVLIGIIATIFLQRKKK
ncbi:MAG: hypothetical protein ACXW00_09140 [Methylobacter sp.]|jgi:DNA repair exonuclease SbcCD ATPase subunit